MAILYLSYKEDSKGIVFGSCEEGFKGEGHNLKCPSPLRLFVYLLPPKGKIIELPPFLKAKDFVTFK